MSFATPQTVPCQAPLSMEFSRQEYWSGLPFPSSRDLPNRGVESVSPALADGFCTTEPPGKLYVCVCVCVFVYEVKVAQSCPTLCDPMDYTVHGILQARILDWVAFPFSRGSSQARDQTEGPALQMHSLPDEPQGRYIYMCIYIHIYMYICICILADANYYI